MVAGVERRSHAAGGDCQPPGSEVAGEARMATAGNLQSEPRSGEEPASIGMRSRFHRQRRIGGIRRTHGPDHSKSAEFAQQIKISSDVRDAPTRPLTGLAASAVR